MVFLAEDEIETYKMPALVCKYFLFIIEEIADSSKMFKTWSGAN